MEFGFWIPQGARGPNSEIGDRFENHSSRRGSILADRWCSLQNPNSKFQIPRFRLPSANVGDSANHPSNTNETMHGNEVWRSRWSNGGNLS